MLRIPIRNDKKRNTPDWPIQPYVPRSAEDYEPYNTPKPKKVD